MNKSELFEETLKESNFEFTSIENLGQFNEGLDYITEQIGSIHEAINDAIDDELVSFGLLNESKDYLNKIWKNAKDKIEKFEKKVYSISSILQDFLRNEPITRKGREVEFTRDNCINSRILVDGYTNNVEFNADEYRRQTKELNYEHPYPIKGAIEVYNVSIDDFNKVLSESRNRLGIAPEELPNARRADVDR